jgi:hypothetical protein
MCGFFRPFNHPFIGIPCHKSVGAICSVAPLLRIDPPLFHAYIHFTSHQETSPARPRTAA